MILNVLGCIFAVIAIMYTFRCVAGIFYKKSTSMFQIFLMAVGIVGTIACFFIF